jgi:hypothetical protein
VLLISVFMVVVGCLAVASCSGHENDAPPPPAALVGEAEGGEGAAGGGSVETVSDPSKLIGPTNLVYLGAFRLPDSPDSQGWEYGGGALTYRPGGDPAGAADGYPGSLFGAGFEPTSYVSEITIPAPVISRANDPAGLNTATTLQGFSEVGGGWFDNLHELPRLGLCFLSTPETGEKLFLSWGQHFQEEPGLTAIPSHAWLDPDLSHPNTRGAWWIGNESPYSVNNYIFEIPRDWADAHAGGRRLATGRFRDGGWSGKGPSLFAYGPWLDGNPPPNGARLTEVPLIRYSHTRADPFDETDFHLSGYQHPDEWEGGAWLTTTDGRSAVIFVGTKGTGDHYWYGWVNPAGPEEVCVDDDIVGEVLCYNADGTPCPPEISKGCAGHTSDRGWWSSRFDAEIIFYDPAVLAATAEGKLSPSQPQPYAVLDIDEYLFLPDPCVESMSTGAGDQRRNRLGETAYDREHNLLYVVERFAEGPKPVVHVFRVR